MTTKTVILQDNNRNQKTTKKKNKDTGVVLIIQTGRCHLFESDCRF